MSKFMFVAAVLLLVVALNMASPSRPSFGNPGVAGSSASVSVQEFMANKKWGCSRSGNNCFDMKPKTGNTSDCPEDAKSYICRPGFYEALDGTCQSLTRECYRDAHANATNLERCSGCRLEDRPEGETELGCLDAEATCLRDYNENVQCREDEKRFICPRGYYRAMPENKCYKNANVQRNKAIPKDGCVDLFRSRCRPNSHPVCITTDVVEDPGLYCGLVFEKHEGPLNLSKPSLNRSLQGEKHESAFNRAGPLNDNDNCTGSIYCKCDPGYLRWYDKADAIKCIPEEDCVERP